MNCCIMMTLRSFSLGVFLSYNGLQCVYKYFASTCDESVEKKEKRNLYNASH